MVATDVLTRTCMDGHAALQQSIILGNKKLLSFKGSHTGSAHWPYKEHSIIFYSHMRTHFN